jgi:hypothetical protein
LTVNRNKLRQKRETGININGKFIPPQSEECKSVLKHISIVQNMTFENIRRQRKKFELGPLSEKALVLGSLYKVSTQEVHVNVIDITLNDKLELAWKRQLNNLYTKQYLKPPKV